MDANILCTLLAQRIPPEQFQVQVHGLEVVFFDPDQNNKPVGSPNESPYDTPENRAIVDDVIKNYDALAGAYVPPVPSYPLADLISFLVSNGTLPTDGSLPDSLSSMAAVKTAITNKLAGKSQTGG